jgi:[amino group carrier protein]-L-2-aminoadipate 6-kinase
MIVIKIGGAKGVDFSLICKDIATLKETNEQLILVHGGSSETNLLCEKLGFPPRFITSPSGYTSRHTDRNTMEIFMMAVNGKVNSLLVEELQKEQINAVGLSGMDGRIMVAVRKGSVQSIEGGKRKIIRDDYTGKIETVNHSLLTALVSSGYIPVISPIAISYEGEALNVDADRAAAMIAVAVKAQHLVLLTGVPGLMKNFPDESSLIKNLSRQQLDSALSFAQGRMKKKILAADEALSGGVDIVTIADGRIQNPISQAL